MLKANKTVHERKNSKPKPNSEEINFAKHQYVSTNIKRDANPNIIKNYIICNVMIVTEEKEMEILYSKKGSHGQYRAHIFWYSV